MAGGALYNNLDYSFTAGHEDGTFAYPAEQPGGGTPALRKQLRHLREFLDGFDYVKMAPHPEIIAGGVPEGASARVLAQPGKAYAIYLHHGREVKGGKPKYQVDGARQNCTLALDLPAGQYDVSWYSTTAGTFEKRDSLNHPGGRVVIAPPSYSQDVALRIMAR
jgi:hypothetical protein